MTKRKSQYKKIAAVVDRHGIPQTLLAELTGTWRPDGNAFLRGRITVSPEREALIRQAVEDVVRVLKTAPYRPDLTRTAEVRKLIVATKDKEAQMLLPLPETEGNAAIAAEAATV